MITAQVIDLDGREVESVEDPASCMGTLLARAEPAGLVLLRYVDPRGDTLFNSVQAVPLIVELKSLELLDLSFTEAELLTRLIRAARLVKVERHFLRFRGE